ncbi:MurR/RpiR family transcriptional regulator [Oceanobacillus piezotolerans]|uniref:MurR/RpiR family transcriptional regulator n=1 Tax=Oceanobacillus piezotolerans TaxID=2448030 RepID=A0A498DR90_9BACI|nr:MurR/RpiR family transcriptional regulator [Oceanobacillus piezotolerans]RLL46979.1 MurR/RpiR family transcriptional regulator [Oceanobacillus piezotolerans]
MGATNGGLIMLKEMENRLPPSEQKIAQYILENPEESISLTALALGEKSQTSSAAVIRLCKSLGLSGFQELKIRVAGDLQERSRNEYHDIEPNEGFQTIINKVTANTIQTLKETGDILSEKCLEEAVRVVSHAKSCIFFGVGASYLAAKDAEQKFLRINKNVYSFSDIHQAATVIANKGPEDVVIGISFSGNTEEVVKLLQLAKEKSIPTISITKYGSSKVNNLADIQLYTSAAKEAMMRSGATSSRIAQLHVIDILFMSLASAEYEETVKHLEETREAISFIKRNQ